MKTTAKLIMCLGLALSFNTFANHPAVEDAAAKSACEMCAKNCAGEDKCPPPEVCASCKNND